MSRFKEEVLYEHYIYEQIGYSFPFSKCPISNVQQFFQISFLRLIQCVEFQIVAYMKAVSNNE